MKATCRDGHPYHTGHHPTTCVLIVVLLLTDFSVYL